MLIVSQSEEYILLYYSVEFFLNVLDLFLTIVTLFVH